MIRIYFRPLLGFTLFFAPMLVLLVGLGVWQLERLQWKLALIAQVTHNMSAAPISLDQALALRDRAQYRRVALTGTFENSKEAYFYTTGPDGGAVYHLLTPFRLDDGRTVIIDRGYVPAILRNPASRPDSELQDETRVIGIWRLPDRPGPFTPAPDVAHRIWFARDIADIARSEHLKLAAQAIVEATTPLKAEGWPRGAETRINIPNDHLQYALTWFVLAAALLVIYFAYHRTRGRLALRRDG